MIRDILQRIKLQLQEILKSQFQVTDFDIPDGTYPDPQMGDLSFTLCLPLAKVLRKNPKLIAARIVEAFPLETIPEVARLEVGGNGYLNFHLNRTRIASALYENAMYPEPVGPGITLVEHTSINPNKAAHVGHLRNAVLGDTLVRLLKFQGNQVHVQNYIDDTGVQLADVVVGYKNRGGTIEELDRIPGRLDYYFWDLYAETHSWLEESAENRKLREDTLRAMEEREEPLFSFAQAIADRIIRCHLMTMDRLNIHYELLPRESDILGRKFWQRTFEMLKDRSAITKVEEGKNRGCWVMSLEGSDAFEDMQNPDKVIVRSNGIVTYVGKDIAYQLWKFGLLGLDFFYREFDKNPDGSVLWTTSTNSDDAESTGFGHADTVYNVIDQRQSYLQKVVAQGLRALGFSQQADRSIHFAYEMVTLSPKTAMELGFQLSDEAQEKSFVEMAGRKGIGVKADDLLDRIQERALERIVPLYPDKDPEELRELSAQIATGAVRYFMLRYSRNTLITFDMDEALNFEGETGPYLQYSLVRARSIFSKLLERGIDPENQPKADVLKALERMGENDSESEDSWRIILEIIKTKDMISKSLRSLEISFYAKFVFQLAQRFNYYYHKYPILHEKDESRKVLRIAVVRMFAQVMEIHLQLLGIPVPARM